MRKQYFLKTVLCCLALLCTTAKAENTDLTKLRFAIYAEPITVTQGTTECTLSIRMKNEFTAKGSFQFQLSLPEGFSIATTGGEPSARLSNERTNSEEFDDFQPHLNDDGSLIVLAFNREGEGNIEGNDGEIAQVDILLPADVALGEYTLAVKNMAITLENGDDAIVWGQGVTDFVYSTLTVVEPPVTFITLDENAKMMPEATANTDVLVRRTIKANEWSTLCLPFAMTEAQVKTAFGNDVQLGDFTGYDTEEDEDGNTTGISVGFSEATAIEANHPYIIKVSTPVSEFMVDGVDVEPEEVPCISFGFTTGKGKNSVYHPADFTGTYTADFDFYNDAISRPLFLSGNRFYYATEKTMHMKAFRAYFDFDDVLADVEEEDYSARLAMHFTGSEATGVQSVAILSQQATQTYDLQGRKVVAPARKGIYVKDGQKVIIK